MPKTLRSRNMDNYFSEKELNIRKGIVETNINNYNMLSDNKKEIKIKYNPNKKGKFSEKEINNLLDVYKNVYPIKEKLNELYTSSNYYNLNKNKNEKRNNLDPNNNNDNENEIKKEKVYNSIDNIYRKLPRYSLAHIDKKLINKKQKTFRQNIFNN